MSKLSASDKGEHTMAETITINSAPAQRATGATPKVEQVTWRLRRQEVVAYGSPSDAGEGGRRAVQEHADALRRLRDH
jgi:hypothetical protein